MDARIILAAQQPDFVNVLAQSNQAAQQRINFDQQNALSSTYRDQGPGILAGDPNALNALARLDPNAALGVQQTRLGMDATRQGMEGDLIQRKRNATADSRGDEEWKWKVEEYAAKKTAAERAAEAAQIEDAVKTGLAARSPQEWDQLVTQMGAPELVGQYGNREAVANRYLSVADILKRSEPPKADVSVPTGYMLSDPANPGAGVKLIPGYIPKDSNGITITNPDGTTTQIGGTPKPPTEQQSKLALFASMMDSTMPVINGLEAKMDPANVQDRAAAAMGTVGNFLKTGEYQRYEAAGRAWAEAALRLQTGAAATDGEVQRIFSTYFAQAGDDPETVKYKQQLRDQYAEAVGAASGGLIETPGQTAPQGTPPPITTPGGAVLKFDAQGNLIQ